MVLAEERPLLCVDPCVLEDHGTRVAWMTMDLTLLPVRLLLLQACAFAGLDAPKTFVVPLGLANVVPFLHT